MGTSIVGSWVAGRLSSTKYILRNTPERVRVTRRHHPLLGQELEVLIPGKGYLVVRHQDGAALKISRAWTDADGGSPEPLADRSTRRLSVEALRALLDLSDVLRQRS